MGIPPIARAEYGPFREDSKQVPRHLQFDDTNLARRCVASQAHLGILIVQDPHDADATGAVHSREAKQESRRPRLELELGP